MFGAFSAPDELAKWWGPEGFTAPSLEFDPRVHEIGYKRNVPGEPIELCDHQGGFVNATGRQGFGELRSVRTTAAFDFRELAEGLYAVEVGLDGLPLRLKPEPAAALASRADAEISNNLVQFLVFMGCYFVCNVGCIEYNKYNY